MSCIGINAQMQIETTLNSASSKSVHMMKYFSLRKNIISGGVPFYKFVYLQIDIRAVDTGGFTE